jgi:acyl-CoA synthetase (AMP-forming)/AMP-acid ligase II
VRLSDSGEILVRNDISFDGYFEDEPATAAAVDADGWFHTGDLGAFDDEGYVSIVGRAKDVIRTGGETVAPVEVEAALADHPNIADVAVVGLPHPDWGEVVCAVVVAVDGHDAPDLNGLREWCAKRLAGFKVPRQLAVVDALPRTAATGQVQRALLVERLQLA